MTKYIKYAVGVVAFVAVAAIVNVASAAVVVPPNLSQGSTGAQVMALQTALNVSPVDGKFGPMTKAAVVAYQGAHGLNPDGVVGPLTAASINNSGTTSTGTDTGTGTGTSSCASGWKFDPVTGEPCGSTSTSTTLSGGAGDLTITKTSSEVEDTVKEGGEDVNILGAKAEADGSDIAITSIKVSLKNTNYASSSENFNRYIDNVSIWLDGKNVGSADASDFSKTSGSPDEFSKTIALSNAIVKDGKKLNLYVAVSALSNIDTNDLDATWDIQVDTLRFTDATGAILSADVSAVDYTANSTFTFDDASTDDQIDLKSSSSNPKSQTIQVNESTKSDDYLALAYKLDVDDDSSDVMITSLPVTLTVANGGTDTDSIENIVDSVVISVDGDKYTADLDTDSVNNGSGSATYSVSFDDDELTIDSGDVVEVKVYVTFKKQDGNYDENTTVYASVGKTDIDAETDNDELPVTGSSTITGGTLTLNTSSATISGFKWSVNSTGTIVDFFFTVEANDSDFDVLAADITDSVSGTATVTNTASTPETTNYGILSRQSGDAVDAVGSTGFTVEAGETTTFKVRYTLSGSNGTWKEVNITSVSGHDVPDDDEVSPTATVNVS